MRVLSEKGTTEPQALSRGEKIELALIMLLAAALRVAFLLHQSLTADEAKDLEIAHKSVSEIFHFPDGFPPLYNTILHVWLHLTSSPYAGRWLGVAFGVGAVLALWRLGRRLGGPAVGLYSALALAASPFHIWYSQEGRAYSLYFLLGAGGIVAFVEALDTDRWRSWLWFACVVVAGLWTHYYTLLLLGTSLLLVVIERRSLRGLLRPAVSYVLIILALLPILLVVPADLSSEQSASVPVAPSVLAGGYVLLSFAVGHTIGPSIRELHVLTGTEALRQILPWLIPIGVIFGVLGLRGLAVLRRQSSRSQLRIWVFLLVPVGLALALAATVGVTFKVRHVIWAAAPLVVVVGAGAADVRRSRSSLAAAAVVGLCGVWGLALCARNLEPRYENEDIAAAAKYLRSHGADGQPVYVTPTYMLRLVKLYLSSKRTVSPLPERKLGTSDVPTALRVLTDRDQSRGVFWILYTRPFHSDPDGSLIAGLQALPGITTQAEFPGVLLLRGQGRTDSVALPGARVVQEDTGLASEARALAAH